MIEHILAGYYRAYGLIVHLHALIQRGRCRLGRAARRAQLSEDVSYTSGLRVVLGMPSHISVFGRDFGTQDGTYVCDYINVLDLFEAVHCGQA